MTSFAEFATFDAQPPRRIDPEQMPARRPAETDDRNTSTAMGDARAAARAQIAEAEFTLFGSARLARFLGIRARILNGGDV